MISTTRHSDSNMSSKRSYGVQSIRSCLSQDVENKWTGPFVFVQAADTQLGLIDRYVEKKPEPNWDKEKILTKKAVDAINLMRPKPRFVSICGDLVDAYPTQPDLQKAQIADLKAILSGLDPSIPLVCVCGNHDVGDNPTRDAVMTYRKNFGEDYFSFWCGGVLFLVINSQYYVNREHVPRIAAEHDKWLDDQLNEVSRSRPRHVVVFQHVPPFVQDVEEADTYFSIHKKERKILLEKLRKAGVCYVFCGHYHRNGGGRYQDVEVVVTSAIGAQLGSDVHGFRVVRVYDGDIEHDYYSLEDVPAQIKL